MSQSAARGLQLSQASPRWLCAVGVCHLVGAEAHVHKAGRPQPSSGSSFCPCGSKATGFRKRTKRLSAVPGKTTGLGCQAQEIHTQ